MNCSSVEDGSFLSCMVYMETRMIETFITRRSSKISFSIPSSFGQPLSTLVGLNFMNFRNCSPSSPQKKQQTQKNRERKQFDRLEVMKALSNFDKDANHIH